MAKLISKIVRTMLSVVLYFASLTYGHSQTSPLPPLNPQELGAVIQEIKAMGYIDEVLADAFVVHEATPERIDRLYQMPEFLQQPQNIREKGLVLAGQGALLSFDKPSDVIVKMGAWFPQEIAAAKTGGSHTPIRLFGPYPSWKDEQTAFLALWECMPENVWLNPTQNPFLIRPDQGDFASIADTASGQFNFGACVHERSGWKTVWPADKESAMKQEALEIGNKAAPVLQRKFAHYLSNNRCQGTGPDDCVLLLMLWSSLSPADVELAKMLQTLEADVDASGPIKPLSRGNMHDAYVRNEPGIENVSRKAAFLRLKQSSLNNAATAWPPQTQQTIIHQMSDLGLGYDVAKIPQAQTAVLAELENLLKNSSCDAIVSLLTRNPSLQATFVLQHLQDPKPNCFVSRYLEWEWLKKGESDEARDLRSRYLSLLGHQESGAVHEMLLENLTNHGKDCFDKEGAPSQDWQETLCKTWVSEPQTASFQLQHSHLVLDKTNQFQAIPLQLPPSDLSSPPIDPWLYKLVEGMNAAEQRKMQTFIAELHRRQGVIGRGTWWKHPQHDKSLVDLQLSINTQSEVIESPYEGWRFIPYEGKQLFLVFDAQSFSIVGMPFRMNGENDGRQVVQVSDLDEDGNLEAWLARVPPPGCQGDDSDLERGLDCSDKSAKSAEMGEIWGNALSHFANSPKMPKTQRQAVDQTKTNAYTAALMAVAVPEPAQLRNDYQTCNIRLISPVLSHKLTIDYADNGDLIDWACKAHPLHPEQTIVALFHNLKLKQDKQMAEQKGFAVAVIDLKQNKLISLYQDSIEEDPTIRIERGGLTIDTARYNLAPGVRALGVRMNISYSPRYAEGGEGDYLWLFVEEDNSLRPVLKNLAMSSWQLAEGSPVCGNDEECSTDSVTLTLELAATSTNGWRDLQVVEHHQTDLKEHKQLGVKLRASGKMYSGELP